MRQLRLTVRIDPLPHEPKDPSVLLVFFHDDLTVVPHGSPVQTWKECRYLLGGPNAADFDRIGGYADAVSEWAASRADWYILPVCAYINNGITLHLGSSRGWDITNGGAILVRRGDVGIEEYRGVADNHIDDWNRYLAEDVWEYVIEERISCDHCGSELSVDPVKRWGDFASAEEAREEGEADLKNYA